MKRAFGMLLAVLMVFLMIPSISHAASENITISVTADKTTANPGDTINFNVILGKAEDMAGLDFELDIPKGLSPVPGSFEIRSDLAEIMKPMMPIIVPSTEREDGVLRWYYFGNGYTGDSDLCILSFSCTVDADAAFEEKSVNLKEMACGSFTDAINTTVLPATITVEKVKVYVSSVSLDKTTLTLKDGDTAKLTATVVPADADNRNVTWNSDNVSVATVSSDGTVTAVKAGTANITVTTEDGGKTASCAVTVNCNHSMTRTDAVEATCGKDGNMEYYTCGKCNRKFADEAGTKEVTDTVVPATGKHGSTAISGAVAPTEEQEGYTGDTYCDVCGQKIATGQVIPKLPHTHNMVKTDAVKPTCDRDGNMEYYTCSKCGKRYADAAGTKELTDVVDKAKGHSGNTWSSDETSHWKTCTVCGAVFDKSEHTYKWVVDKAATEDETGLGHEECICGAIRNRDTEIPKLDHVHTDIRHHKAIAATCMAEGNVEYWTCSSQKCEGKYYGDAACQIAITETVTPINPDSHVGTGKWDADADRHVYTCTCGKVLVDYVHSFDADTDADCDLCGYRRFYLIVSGADAVYVKDSEQGLTIRADGDYSLFDSVEVDGKKVDPANYEVKEGSTIITLKKSYLDTLTAATHNIRVLYADGKAADTQFTIKEKNSSDGNNNSNNNAGSNNTNNTTNNNGNAADNASSSQTQEAISPKTGEEGQNQLPIVIGVIAACIALAAELLVYYKVENKKQKKNL